MIDRIFKSWKTSLVGLLVLGIGSAAVFMDKATLTEFGAFLGVALALFFYKEKPKSE